MLLIAAALFLPSSAAMAADAKRHRARPCRHRARRREARQPRRSARAAQRSSASIALIDEGRIAFARAYGKDATPDTLYQAASLSKFVAAIGAMRLVESGTLKLDEDVNEQAHLVARAGQLIRRDAQGHVARAAQHDRRHRRARLPRLRGWRSAPDAHANSRRRAAGQFAAGHGDRRSRQRLSLFRRRL